MAVKQNVLVSFHKLRDRLNTNQDEASDSQLPEVLVGNPAPAAGNVPGSRRPFKPPLHVVFKALAVSLHDPRAR